MNTLLITVNLSNDDSSIPHCTLKWGPKPTNPEEYKDTSLLLALAINEKASLTPIIQFCLGVYYRLERNC